MIYKKFIETSLRNPDGIAIIDDDEGTIPYTQLRKKINLYGNTLRSLGIKKGDAVLVLLPNDSSFVISIFAVLGIGAIVAPSNTSFSQEEIQYYCDSISVAAIIHNSDVDETVKQLSGSFIDIPIKDIEHPDSESITENSDLTSAIEGDTPALYMFSSGSTGKPKRITRTHANIIEEFNALSTTIDLSEDDKIVCTIPLYHSHGFGNCMMASILKGCCLILLKGPFNPRATLRSIERNNATIYPAVPFMFKLIAETRFKEKPNLDSLRLLFSAGAALTEDVFIRFKEAFGHSISQLYGSTETGAVSINYNARKGTDTSVGLPLHGYRIHIMDEEGNFMDKNKIGQIAIQSPAMTTQYDDLPELSSECFVNDCFLSGDLGLKDENGLIYIKGRKKLLINVAGNKVDPLDVETVIQSHPAVTEVVVVGKEHAHYGEIIKAAIVCNRDCSSEEIINYCQQSLIEYKVPKIIEFRESIPKSPLGKILRKYL